MHTYMKVLQMKTHLVSIVAFQMKILHIFSSCPHYATQREIMLHTVYNFTIPVSVTNLLYGNNKGIFTVNKQIYNAVQIFIKKIQKIISIV